MNKNIDIQTVMTICPHSVGLDQDITVAREMMKRYNFHHLPVLEGGRILGVVSDRDLRNATNWMKTTESKLTMEDVYSSEPYVVSPESKLEEVLRVMVREQYGCVLVATAEQKLVGIFTMTDACRYLADLLAA